ncbi:MAG: hypothetical protein QOJ83_1063, partial [Frankiales bacterium]|nr:hypothetical protein [Frankiales bacterium]
ALVSPWWWGGVAFAVLPLLLEKLDDSQPSDFDGPGVGIEVAVFIAVVNVIVWLLGRWIRHRVRGVDEPS